MTNSPPFVIHVSQIKDYPGAVYIGRSMPRQGLKRSKWANPYKIGDAIGFDGLRLDRASAIHRYAVDFKNGGSLNDQLHELTGKPIACWCRKAGEERTPDNACHGDVLVDLWNEVS